MQNEEHTQKDFQVATQSMLMEQGALLRTILQNQMLIMKWMSKTNKSYHKEINEFVAINRKFMEETMKQLPNHSDMEVPMRDV